MSAPQEIQNKNTGNHKARGESLLVRATITLIAICFLGIHLFTSTKIDNISLALLVLAAVPWLVPFLRIFLKSIEILGAKVEFLENKTVAQEKQILRQQELITTLYQAAQHNLTTYEYRHLVNLRSDASGYTYNGFLPLEMVRLCHHEFVTESFPGSTWQMEHKGATPFNLGDFYHITERGRAHILLIEKLRKRASAFGEEQ